VYAVKTPLGLVAGVNAYHMCVQTTKDPAHAKTWKTEAGATRWMKKNSDAGMGLNSATAEVIKL